MGAVDRHCPRIGGTVTLANEGDECPECSDVHELRAHSLYIRKGETVTLRLQDGDRGRVLGRWRGGTMGALQTHEQCPECRGRCVQLLAAPIADRYGPGKHQTHGACPKCSGAGMVSTVRAT